MASLIKLPRRASIKKLSKLASHHAEIRLDLGYKTNQPSPICHHSQFAIHRINMDKNNEIKIGRFTVKPLENGEKAEEEEKFPYTIFDPQFYERELRRSPQEDFAELISAATEMLDQRNSTFQNGGGRKKKKFHRRFLAFFAHCLQPHKSRKRTKAHGGCQCDSGHESHKKCYVFHVQNNVQIFNL